MGSVYPGAGLRAGGRQEGLAHLGVAEMELQPVNGPKGHSLSQQEWCIRNKGATVLYAIALADSTGQFLRFSRRGTKASGLLAAQCTKAAATCGLEVAQESFELTVELETVVVNLGCPWQTGHGMT